MAQYRFTKYARKSIEHSLEASFECAHSHQWHQSGDEAPRIRGNLIDVGKRVGEIRRRFADHRYRNVSESWVLREYGEECLDHARGESIANDDAIDIPVLRCLAAASTLSAPAILTRSPIATLRVG
ncbi:MAG: hypothetical protein WA769_22270 [Pseudolabrys sp.]